MPGHLTAVSSFKYLGILDDEDGHDNAVIIKGLGDA